MQYEMHCCVVLYAALLHSLANFISFKLTSTVLLLVTKISIPIKTQGMHMYLYYSQLSCKYNLQLRMPLISTPDVACFRFCFIRRFRSGFIACPASRQFFMIMPVRNHMRQLVSSEWLLSALSSANQHRCQLLRLVQPWTSHSQPKLGYKYVFDFCVVLFPD